MSENNDNKNNIPLECPSRTQKIVTDPIVDVVENLTFPPQIQEIENIISKAPQE